MPHPLPKAVRERCVRFVEAGHSCHEAARRFEVSPSFVINLMTLYRETGRVEPRPRGGHRHSKLNQHREFILRQVERKSDITMSELAVLLSMQKQTVVAPATLSRWLLAHGLSFKKTLRASEQDRPDIAALRVEWKTARQPIMRRERHRLVFLDETSANTKMVRLRGRCSKGERLHAKAPFCHWKTQTLIAGLRHDGLIAPFVIDAPMNRVIFDTYIETQLVPRLQPGDIVIMDNLAAHKSPAAEAAIRAKGAWMLYLPPYSPDLNPIKMAFSKLKENLRATAARTIDDLWKAIGNICKLFSKEECSNYFTAAGYGFN
jgi:transposase